MKVCLNNSVKYASKTFGLVCCVFHLSDYLFCLFKQIVDFCCGANDFSCLMKKKLEDAGKKCYFKNYDVMQPKVSSSKYFILYIFIP